MPLDHYVSQVHLKNFYSPQLKEKMYTIQKPSLNRYECDAKSQCRIMDGNTNPFLQEPRVIEEFLKSIEPKYNKAINTLREGKVSAEAVFTIAGFAAYVAICSQAAFRLNPAPLRATVEETCKLAHDMEELSPIPKVLNAGSVRELIDSGNVEISVDPKYAQAHGINLINHQINSWGNSQWQIIINEHKVSPFFTSDFPIAIQKTDDPRVLNRIIPLAPDLAIKIIVDVKTRGKEIDFNFPRFRHKFIKANNAKIREINTAIVQCAESNIYFPYDAEWIPRFIQRHRYHRIEPFNNKIPIGNGTMLHCGMLIDPYSLQPSLKKTI